MHRLQMLVPPFVQLRFRIWQRIGVDPQIQFRFGWLAKIPGWDVVATIAAAVALGWYVNNEAASVTRILFPVAIVGVASIVAAVIVSLRPETRDSADYEERN